MAKRKLKASPVVESAAVNDAPSPEQLVEGLLNLVPELEESISQADMILALDDVGYITGNKTSGGELTPERRNKIIRESRFYWHRDPLGKQPVRLWSDYAIGTGITYKTEGEEEASNSDIQKQLDRFWKYHKNRCLTNSQGQWELSTQLLVDGDIFFAIFTNGDVPVIRTIDCLQMTDIITDPDDELAVLAFKREIVDPKGARKTLYYRNWSAEQADVDKAKDPATGQSFTVEDNVVIYQHSFEKFGKRGNGLLSCVIDWSRYHRAFMNARVSLTQALAKFAFKLTAKGSDKVVKAVAQRLGSSLASAPVGSIERNPPTTAGGTFVQNQGLDLEAMPRTTGGGDAKSDGDQLKLMVCAGTNVHQHYFGDPSCYSADTEVLTEKGFIPHSEWQPGNRVATFNPERREIEFHHPQELRVFDYVGEMVRFKNSQTDILVTPNHRMWTAPQVNWKLLPATASVGKSGRPRVADGGAPQVDRAWRFQEARELQTAPRAHGWRFTAAAPYQRSDVQSFDTVLGTVDARAFARFLGYWLSEGSTLHRKQGAPVYRVQLAQREGAVAEKMRDTLMALGLRWNETANQSGCKMLTFNHKALWTWLRDNCGTDSHSKRIPAFLLEAGDSIRRDLYDALMEGDGGASGACSRYSSVSKQLADDMQRLALSLNYGAAVTVEAREYKGTPHFIWRVWIRNQWIETRVRPGHITSEQYEGKVYCFHLPNHIYVTRRNGKIAIQGNTGNLATAEAMELPMLKSFTRYQESWKDCWRDIFSIVLEEEPDGDPAAITIHLPAMLKDDLGKLGIFLEGLHQVFPEIQVPEILEMCLVALGAPNVEDIMASIAEKAAELAAAQAAANAQADGNIVGANGSNAGSLAASKSPLGNQLPQPSVKVSRFTVPPKGAKESTADYNLRVLRGMMGQRRLQAQPTEITVPMVVHESEHKASDQPKVTEAIRGLSETVKRLETMFESRQRLLDDEDANERSARINQVLQKEDESVRAINRLTEALLKDPAPLLDSAAMERFLDKSKPAKIAKSGTITRDHATGEMKFAMEETPVDE